MNINSGGKQRKLHDTVIPLCNPDPAPGEEDTCRQIQQMCFLGDHSDPKLRGQPKGIRIVLQECKSVWDKYTLLLDARGANPVGKCSSCLKSQVKKDTERRSKTEWSQHKVPQKLRVRCHPSTLMNGAACRRSFPCRKTSRTSSHKSKPLSRAQDMCACFCRSSIAN
jgi:hypothetical protein